MTPAQRARLEAEASQLRAILAKLPPSSYLMRNGFESRLTKIDIDLRNASSAVPRQHAQAKLLFGGAPVIGTVGIEANFAANATKAFQDLVSKLHASRSSDVSETGPIPLRKESALHITNIAQGSFGFVLEEIAEQGPITETPLAETLATATTLVDSAALGDEPFAEQLADVDDRTRKSLSEFFDVLANAGATVKISSAGLDIVLDTERIADARNRVATTTIADKNETLDGTLLSLAPIARRFEIRLRDGVPITGKVSKTVDDLEEKNRTLSGQTVRSTFHVRTTKRGGAERVRRTLVSIESL